MLRRITWCISLPLLWLGQGATILKMPVSMVLLKAAWRLGGESTVAASALVQIQQKVSLEAARAQAAAWFVWRPDPAVAALAGLLACEAGDLEDAQAMLTAGQQLGPDSLGLIELLEFQVTAGRGDNNALAELVRRLELRHDLSPTVSKIVHTHLLAEAMLAGRHEETQRRATWLWNLEDEPMAATALWVLSRVRGRHDDFDRYCVRLTLSPPQRLYYQTLGQIAAGDLEDARRSLSLLAEADPSLAETMRSCLEQKGTAG